MVQVRNRSAAAAKVSEEPVGPDRAGHPGGGAEHDALPGQGLQRQSVGVDAELLGERVHHGRDRVAGSGGLEEVRLGGWPGALRGPSRGLASSADLARSARWALAPRVGWERAACDAPTVPK
jgi:hypothetical protein